MADVADESDEARAKLLREIGAPPRHIAVIMDGNGRWAKARGLPRVEGHRQGAKTVRMLVEECRRLGVRYLTLFTFSTENWARPLEEVNGLMKLFQRYLESELELMLTNGVRLRAIGDRSKLPRGVVEILERNERETAHLNGMDLILALSYGGRQELVHAARTIAEQVRAGVLAPEQVTEHTLRSGLYAPDIPDPDLLIRTSGEFRISNFLLWQLAYTEIVMTQDYWPEYSKDHFYDSLREYGTRERRFGKTGDQLVNGTTSALV